MNGWRNYRVRNSSYIPGKLAAIVNEVVRWIHHNNSQTNNGQVIIYLRGESSCHKEPSGTLRRNRLQNYRAREPDASLSVIMVLALLRQCKIDVVSTQRCWVCNTAITDAGGGDAIIELRCWCRTSGTVSGTNDFCSRTHRWNRAIVTMNGKYQSLIAISIRNIFNTYILSQCKIMRLINHYRINDKGLFECSLIIF